MLTAMFVFSFQSTTWVHWLYGFDVMHRNTSSKILKRFLFRLHISCLQVSHSSSWKPEYPIVQIAGTAISKSSILDYLMNQLTSDEEDMSLESEGGGDRVSKAPPCLSFRLCMANVLISASQKISDTGKKSFVKKIVPRLICSIGVCILWSGEF